MNLFRYYPLAYTYNTRKKYSWILSYIYIQIIFPSIAIIYIDLIIEHNIVLFLTHILLFIFIHVIFLIFYEIWYLVNDIITSKNEKCPTIRINENINKNFLIFHISIRLILWIILLSLLLLINIKLFTYSWFVILCSQIIFALHNLIRNYVINFVTFFLLRFLKFLTILPILVIANAQYTIFFYLTIIFILDQFDRNIRQYNSKLWWDTKTNLYYKDVYIVLCSIILYFICSSGIFILSALFWLGVDG